MSEQLDDLEKSKSKALLRFFKTMLICDSYETTFPSGDPLDVTTIYDASYRPKNR